MVYESVVGKAPGGIDMVSFFSFLFPSFCFIETHDGYHSSAFGKSKKGRFSAAYGYLGGQTVQQVLDLNTAERFHSAPYSVVSRVT